ncbi:Magnetosome protein Mam-g (greigite specific) [Candidatus Magnetomoraceae bacterium gMMP-15]
MSKKDDINQELSVSKKVPLSFYFQWPMMQVQRSLNNMVSGYKKLFHIENNDLKEMYLNKALAAERKGDMGKNVQYMEMVVSSVEDNDDALYQLGIAYEKNRQYKPALKAYSRVAEINPNHAKAHYRKGLLYFRERDFEATITALEKAEKITPESSEINFRIGQCYDRLKKYDQAISYFKKAITIDPKFLQAYKNMALTYDSIDDHKKALECLKHVLELEEIDG